VQPQNPEQEQKAAQQQQRAQRESAQQQQQAAQQQQLLQRRQQLNTQQQQRLAQYRQQVQSQDRLWTQRVQHRYSNRGARRNTFFSNSIWNAGVNRRQPGTLAPMITMLIRTSIQQQPIVTHAVAGPTRLINMMQTYSGRP
jgi:hypothetical protein